MTISRLLEIIEERQALRERLAALDLEEREILLEMECPRRESVDFSMFKDTTRRLLLKLWESPRRMLSQYDIMHDVLMDEYATNDAVRKTIDRARAELRSKRSLYVIQNIRGKGYQLVISEVGQRVTSSPQIPKNRQKKDVARRRT